MEYDTMRRFSQSTFGTPHFYTDRNAPLTMSYMTRAGADSRSCPLSGAPGGGPVRNRSINGHDDGTTDGGTRKRIAVACARCRKRKIRCTGDPGDGSGCQNCRSAGVEASQCQFHRVGATDVHSSGIMMASGFSNGITGMHHGVHPNAMMPIYNTASGHVYRGLPAGNGQYHHLNARSAMQNWTVPYADETSPVEVYGLDQAGAFLSNSNAVSHAYGEPYRWHQPEPRAAHHSAMLYAQDASVSASYTPQGVPYLNTSVGRGAGTTTPTSPLNMTVLQQTLPVSLPERPFPPADITAPQRRLPAPQPSPAQTSRNAVDQLQDQRLRSNHGLAGSAKPAVAWNPHADVSTTEIQSTSSSDTSSELVPTPVSVSSGSEGAMGYMPVTTSSSLSEVAVEPTTTPGGPSQQPVLNFNTSSLLDAMPAPPNQPTYSNFRNYDLPTSSSTESLTVLARQNSQSNMYSFAKRSSLSDLAGEATLVSGQRYAPLGQPGPQHSSSIEGLRGDAVERTGIPIHRASMGNLNRGY